jgi:hypothetical protein
MDATNQNQSLATRAAQNASITTEHARELAGRLKFMISGGQKLQDNEVYALAHYAAANDLNPFAGECYYIPGAGPCPGIAGWRKKAQEQLIWEAEKAGLPGAHFWVETRAAETGEAIFNPATDIAIVAILRDWITSSRWRHDLYETAQQLKNFGEPNALEEAKKLIGPEPTWTGVGVVFGTENFGGKDKMDRRERAAKRAEKAALRKRFPRVNLPEPEGAQVDYVDDNPAIEKQAPRPREDVMRELGYDAEPQQSNVNLPIEGQVVEPDPEQPPTEKQWTSTRFSLETAKSAKSSDGTLYWDIETKDLDGRMIGIKKALERQDMNPTTRENYLYKRDLIQDILDYRKA